MDPLTHGLATLALQRGFFPRTKARPLVVLLAAGLAADADSITRAFGPAAFLRWHRTATHSLLFVASLALLAFLFSRVYAKRSDERWKGLSVTAVAAAAGLHLALDLCEADPVTPLWPFPRPRLSLDLLPGLDPWLLALLALAILLPELARLVGEEIGSRSKRPRGRNGALAGLACAALYIGLRGLGHAGAVAALEARVFAGEASRRVGAFPDATSPFLWHCVVETQSALDLLEVRSAGEVKDASGITTLHKPEASAMLEAAQATSAAAEFLRWARFPKASVERQADGYSVQLQDVKDQAIASDTGLSAEIRLDPALRVTAAELAWQKPRARL